MNEPIENFSFGKHLKQKIQTRLLIQNKNWIAAMCGETGSGKSYAALSLADITAKRPLTIKRNLVFSPLQFLEKLNNKSLQKGDILIFDEAGVGMSSREWYSLQNKLLGGVLQTFRNMNVGVIFTTPNLSFIDVQARKLFHNYFETVNIDYATQRAKLKVYDIQHNSRLDKTYFKAPIIKQGWVQRRVPYITIPKPRQTIIDEYEKAKSAYTEELNKKAYDDLKESMTPKKDFDYDKVKQDVIQNKDKYIKEYGGKKIIDIDLLQIDYNIGRGIAAKIKKGVEQQL